jgi:methylated-DNA-[protein]-cysteine S-methyltransferase
LEFNAKVWKLMERIPKGQVTTYGLIARKLNTHAYRAVGNACRKNPYAPRVPCHRVVRSDGTIGGFAGKTSGKTVDEKISLLKKEGVEIKDRKIVDFQKILFRF